MADHTQDEYKAVKFYGDNTKPKKAGFSKFQVEDSYYFCRYVDGNIALISQAYTGQSGRDNGIESVRKNEKLSKRYKFNTRGKSGHGFSLRAGNGLEIAISPNYGSSAEAQNVASRLSGASFNLAAAAKAKPAKKAAPKKATPKKVAPKKATAKAASFTAKDGRIENYRPLSFYEKHGGIAEGFNKFEHDGAHYFHYVDGGKVILISESYTSKRGRDNGIASVKKNMVLESAYEHHTHKNGKHYFDINAANKQEIATSRWFNARGGAANAAAKLRGQSTAPRKSNDEDNYPPLAFYRKHTTVKKKGFDRFHGNDGEFYFVYFENNKLALISEGYPTAAIRDVGLESVKKNMKIEKRYVQGTGADGKAGFILRAGNHKEIARSVGYGSAAAAVAGAAYLMGTRRRPTASTTAVAPTKVTSKKAAAAKAPVKPKTVKPAAKKTTTTKTAATLVAGSVAASGLAAKKSEPKAPPKVKETPAPAKETSIPVKAAAIVAAPVAAAAMGAAAMASSKPEPKAAAATSAPAAAATPVAATAAPAAATAATGGSGIWGWLKWLLLALLALLALFFLFKTCVSGSSEAAKTTPVVTEAATPAAVMVTCWNGSEAKDEAACPAKITCWDDSFAASESACPAQPVIERPVTMAFDCWDGSKAVNEAACPAQTVSATIAEQTTGKRQTAVNGQTTAKMTVPSVAGRICGTSPIVLFNVENSTPISVGRLGTNPQFGDSTSYSPDEFFRRLQVKYRTSPRDKSFLDLMARSLGYNAFQDMDASLFSDDRLEYGASGMLGFGTQHALQYSKLNVTDPSHLEAFKVRSANGTDVHFMKRCGNFMYVCQPQR